VHGVTTVILSPRKNTHYVQNDVVPMTKFSTKVRHYYRERIIFVYYTSTSTLRIVVTFFAQLQSCPITIRNAFCCVASILPVLKCPKDVPCLITQLDENISSHFFKKTKIGNTYVSSNKQLIYCPHRTIRRQHLTGKHVQEL